MALYSEKVMDHFTHPRNVGVIEDADGVGEVGNAVCGDIMKMYLKIRDGIIEDVKFETFGCGSAIASSSMATEMIKGKPLSEVLTVTNKAVAEALDGLPAHKLHCSVLAEEAIKAAMPANVGNVFELTKYNSLIGESLKQRWHQAAVESTLLERATAAIDEVMSPEFIAGEVSLRALLEEFVEKNKEEASREGWERPEIRFKDGTIGNSLYLHIYFDPKPEEEHRRERSAYSSSRTERGDYELAHALNIQIQGEREEGEKPWRRTVQLGRVYSATLDEKKVAVDMQIYSKWERMLASLYFGNATLLIDCDADDFSYGLYD